MRFASMFGRVSWIGAAQVKKGFPNFRAAQAFSFVVQNFQPYDF
jgi:hypothetical protein